MNKPLVSVIIPNYNYANYLREAIDSVLNQTYQNIETIVVDDGSKDNSRDVLESYGKEIKAIFQQNQGVSAARNNGTAESKGDYLAFLDADDVWLSKKIEKQIEKFAEDKELGLVHVGVEEINDKGDFLNERIDGMEGWVADELLLFRRSVYLGGCSGMMIPRKVFDEIGGFDLQLGTSADWDLCYQVGSRHRFGFVPDILMKYRIHSSNMHSNIAPMEREMLIGYEKAFKINDEKVQKLKRAAYGNLHQVLAGSYFRAGNYAAFIRTAFKSLVFKPSNFFYFAKFPLRKVKKIN